MLENLSIIVRCVIAFVAFIAFLGVLDWVIVKLLGRENSMFHDDMDDRPAI